MATRHKSRRPATEPTPRQLTAIAARKWHVPFWILWGVKVIETGATGTGIGAVNSSSGAAGPFQFIPETAAAYGVNVNSFSSSAEGAAHYLHDLHKQYGSWEAALNHYSGGTPAEGGYGVATVRSKARSTGITPRNSAAQATALTGSAQNVALGIPEGPAAEKVLEELGIIPKGSSGLPTGPGLEGLKGPSLGSLLSFPDEILEGFQQFTKVAKLITDPKFWIRVGEAIGGVILLYMALKALTGVSASDVPGATAAKTATKAAAFKRLPPATRTKGS